MDLCRRFDEVLQVRPSQEVAKVYKFAVLLILDIDDPPPILSPADALSINRDGAFRTNNCERNHRPDLGVNLDFLIVRFFGIEGVEADVVVNEFRTNLLLEREPLFHRQTVRLRDNRHYVHNLAQLLQHDNVNRTQRMSRRIDEEQRAVNPSVLNVTISHRRQLFSEIRAVLVLDVFDDGVPAIVIIDLVTVSGRVDDVQPQPDTVFHDNMGNGMDFRCLANFVVRSEPPLRVNQVRREKRVDQGRLSQTSLTNDDDIKLETSFQELMLNLTRDGFETDIGVGANIVRLCLGHFTVNGSVEY